MITLQAKTLRSSVVSELRTRAGLYGLMAVYWTACFGLGMFYDRPIIPWIYAPVFAALFILIALAFTGQSMKRVSRLRASGDKTITLATDLKSAFALEDVLRVTLLLTAFSITVSMFQSVKAMIPTIQPFVHDALFAQMDKALHGGFYPHELLQPVLGYPVVSFVLLLLYNLWLPLVFVVFIIQILDKGNAALQRRYLMSFLLAWILIGTLSALLLSSAGPAYYEPVLGLATGTGPYADLMAYYRSAGESSPFFLTDMHDMLWQFYQSGKVGPGAGISAMPSVHVALATHMFLAMRHRSQLAGCLFGAYALVILVGSVHLGWHYAVDGYLGAVLMAAIWWLSGVPDKVWAATPGRDNGARLDQDQGLTP